MPPLRPNTLAEALDILARPMLVQITAGGPPPRLQPHALLMDIGRLVEMAGIHRAGGRISVGANSAWTDIMRSSLLRPAAACLADAAALMEEASPGSVLLHTLDNANPDTPVVLALTALDARAEVAVREQAGRIIRQTLPLRQALQAPPEPPHLLLNVSFAAPIQDAGSALYREIDLAPMQPDVGAAAAWVTITPATGLVTAARLALDIADGWPLTCPAAAALVGRQPQKEAIEAVVRLAQRNCPQPRAPTPPFSLTLSPHMIRETLDRAIARALAATSP